ncbi:MAG: PaaI family thioesterase [Desulfomonile sp.]|jgi:uncharacterized protein (TIGR00369 family)
MREMNPLYVETLIHGTNKCPYFTLLSMKLLQFDIGRSLLQIDVQDKHLQPFGMVHGGVFSSIIDAAAFWAVYPDVDENSGLTSVDLKLNYLAPSSRGKLIATGRRIKLGKTLGLGEAEVTDENGRILAHGTSTLIILPDFPFGHEGTLPPKFIERP